MHQLTLIVQLRFEGNICDGGGGDSRFLVVFKLVGGEVSRLARGGREVAGGGGGIGEEGWRFSRGVYCRIRGRIGIGGGGTEGFGSLGSFLGLF